MVKKTSKLAGISKVARMCFHLECGFHSSPNEQSLVLFEKVFRCCFIMKSKRLRTKRDKNLSLRGFMLHADVLLRNTPPRFNYSQL